MGKKWLLANGLKRKKMGEGKELAKRLTRHYLLFLWGGGERRGGRSLCAFCLVCKFVWFSDSNVVQEQVLAV